MKAVRLKIFAAVILFLFVSPFLANAGEDDNIVGWAWSSNIGWISFNCTNTNSCGLVDYGVNLNADNTLTGYAWSSNVGWIKFGGLSGFPSGLGTQAQNANINGNNMKGWARAVSNGSVYDGWISLSGDSPSGSYGPTYVNGIFSDYAWGSNVIGWINFNIASSPGAPAGCEGVCNVRYYTPVPPPSFSITGPSSLLVQFLNNAGGDSQTGTYFVDNGGTAFTNPVTVSIVGMNPALPSGTTAEYSINGAAFSETPDAVVINSPYTTGFSLKVRFNKNIGTATQYSVVLSGSGTGAPTYEKSTLITPKDYNPSFEEF